MKTRNRIVTLLFAAFCAAGVHADSGDPVVTRAIQQVRAHPEGNSPASIPLADYQGELRDLPIGVFDSGVGGLTVLEAIKALDRHNNATGQPGADGVPDFANEHFVYFGDQANMPYGNYPAAGHTEFLRELAVKDAAFILGRRYWTGPGGSVMYDKPPVKAVVIACNTATAYALNEIRDAVKGWGIPVFVVGVVEAGARGLAETRGSTTGGIAVLATVGTCSSDAYPKAIARAQPDSGDPRWPVWQRGSETLAAAIEGDSSVKQPIREIVRNEVHALLDERRAAGDRGCVGTVVLGCTHYPLVQDEILGAFEQWRQFAQPDGSHPYATLVAPHLVVVDPATWTAEDLWRSLDRLHLWAHPGVHERDRFFISVANPEWPGVKLASDGGLDSSYKFSREAGSLEREDTIVVPLTPGGLPASSAKLVRERLKRTWASLQASAGP